MSQLRARKMHEYSGMHVLISVSIQSVRSPAAARCILYGVLWNYCLHAALVKQLAPWVSLGFAGVSTNHQSKPVF